VENDLTARWSAIPFLVPKMLEPRVDLRRGGIIVQRLAYATVMSRGAAEIAVFVDHPVAVPPLVILEVTLVITIQIPEVVGERVSAREIVHVKEGVRRQQTLAVFPRRSHYYRDREFVIRVPEHLLRQILPAIGVLE